MSVESHLTELERRHQLLEKEIEDCELHPSVDSLKVSELKRRKLKLRDEIMKLQQEGEQEAPG